MNLAKPLMLIVFLALGFGIYMMTGPGVDKAYKEATAAMPGNDPERDKIDEEVLSKYGGYMMNMMRYEKAKEFYMAAVERYGVNGKNFWYNQFQIAQIDEELGNYKEAITRFHMLWQQDGDSNDERVPNRDMLKGRTVKLIEVNGLDVRDYPMD